MRKLTPSTRTFAYVPEIDIRLVNVVETRAIDAIVPETFVSPATGEEFVVIPNDIGLFINQQKLVNFNPELVKQVISEYSRASNPLTVESEKMPDDSILDTVKSRYIQSSCDMSSYVRSLSRATRDVIDDYNRERAQYIESLNSVTTSSE